MITRTVTFEVPDKTRIPEVQAAVSPMLDQHSILERVGGSGQVLTFRVTFALQQEIEPLTKAAYFAAMHITPVEMRIR